MLKQKLLKKVSILFVGDEDTGKTSIIEKYKTGEFNRDIQKTRGYILTEKENITFLDVSGKSSILYNIITPDAVVLTCDIKKLTSIYNLKYRWYERVVREVKRDMYIAINKSDYDNHKKDHDDDQRPYGIDIALCVPLGSFNALVYCLKFIHHLLHRGNVLKIGTDPVQLKGYVVLGPLNVHHQSIHYHQGTPPLSKVQILKIRTELRQSAPDLIQGHTFKFSHELIDGGYRGKNGNSILIGLCDDLIQDIIGKAAGFYSHLPNHLAAQHQVADEPSGIGVFKWCGAEVKLFDFADVMKQGAGSKHIPVKLGIMACQPCCQVCDT